MKASEILGRQQAMHAAHSEWRSDHAAWQDDVDMWSAEVREAIEDLDRIGGLLREFDAALRRHAAMLRGHDTTLAAHERELADLQRKGLGEQYDPETPNHEASRGVHTLEQQTHDALRAKHCEVFARLRKLEAAAMKGPRDRAANVRAPATDGGDR
jgi:hypothetical protein